MHSTVFLLDEVLSHVPLGKVKKGKKCQCDYKWLEDDE